MTRAVALSRIQELGIRGRDDPAAQPMTWASMVVEAGGLRALHEALHPTLLLLALAGYRTDEVVLGPPAGGDVLLVTLSPRSAAATSWAGYMEVDPAPPWPSTSLVRRADLAPAAAWTHGSAGADRRERRAGSSRARRRRLPVPRVRHRLRRPTSPRSPTGSPRVQDPVRFDLSSRIARAWVDTDWDLSTTGLLAALEPDLWIFPSPPMTDDEDLRREAFRALGGTITGSALAGEETLTAFLLEEAVVRNGAKPPSVRDRLTALDPDGAADLERGWNTEADALWGQIHPDAGADPFRAADHRRLSYSELVFDMLNESLISLAGFDPAAGQPAYGGFDLRLGDNDPAAGDTEWVYDGETQSADPGAPALPAHIAELRADLEQIGFGPLADGDADPRDLRRVSRVGGARVPDLRLARRRGALRHPGRAGRATGAPGAQPGHAPGAAGQRPGLLRPALRRAQRRDPRAA